MPFSNCLSSCTTNVDNSNNEEKRIKRERERKQRMNNRRIDKTLSDDRRRDLRCLKLLLLGTGESGKSTIIKQMKIIHITGFTEEEKLDYIPNIKKNVRDAIVAIIAGMGHLQIEFENAENESKRQYLFDNSFDPNYNYPKEFFDYVSDLWNDKGVQECYQRSNEYHLIDSAKYFLERLDVIRQNDYVPDNQDILRCRKMTDAISEITFEIQDRTKTKVNFKVFDVGGQRGERKKWIQLFDTVTAILFLADCSSYDLTLREDRHKNRLLDAIEVFQQAWLNKYLQSVPILVFINKIDILEEKIRVGRCLSSYLNSILPTTYSSLENQQQQQQQQSSSTTSSSQALASTSETKSPTDDKFSNLRDKIRRPSSYVRKSTLPTNSLLPNGGGHQQRLSTMNSIRGSCAAAYQPSGTSIMMNGRQEPATALVASFKALAEYCCLKPFESFEPSHEERKEFLSSFPRPQNQITTKGGHSRSKELPDVHPETIRTACYIKNMFVEITKQRVLTTYKTIARDRKSFFFYTCAVNTDNIQKVLDGCGAFLMEEHLEKFGIL